MKYFVSSDTEIQQRWTWEYTVSSDRRFNQNNYQI